MHKGKYVFAQLLDFIDKDVFLRIANKYDGNRYVKQFTCWNQLAVLMFGQLSSRKRLRDVVLATQAHASKAYHLGFGKHAAKSTLADANTKRDYRIFEVKTLLNRQNCSFKAFHEIIIVKNFIFENTIRQSLIRIRHEHLYVAQLT